MQKNKSHLRESRVKRMTKTEAAWLAGFFDGEGSISKSKHTNGHSKKVYRYWKLTLPNTSKDALRKVVRVTGVGKLSSRPKKQVHWKDQWLWQVEAVREIRDIGKQILPYLSIVKKIKRFNSALV